MRRSAPVGPGEILAGKYRIERVLGAGGMGVVAAARHLELDDRVAIKFLLPEALRHPETVARFEREARLAVKIRSEHVARTLDVGRFDGGAPYIVMEYLEGTDLAAALEAHGRLPVRTAIDYVMQACEALAEAHAAGIVHRDLKPANLFVTRRADGSPCIKLLDFGISKVGADASAGNHITQTHDTLGTPLYMSPEQLTSPRDIDQRSDIWSLGVIVYQLLSDKPPFDGASMASVSVAILSQPPPSLAEGCPDAPAGLVAAVGRALSKSPNDRPRNLGELGEALAPYGSSEASRSLAYGSSEASRSLAYVKRVLSGAGSVANANAAASANAASADSDSEPGVEPAPLTTPLSADAESRAASPNRASPNDTVPSAGAAAGTLDGVGRSLGVSRSPRPLLVGLTLLGVLIGIASLLIGGRWLAAGAWRAGAAGDAPGAVTTGAALAPAPEEPAAAKPQTPAPASATEERPSRSPESTEDASNEAAPAGTSQPAPERRAKRTAKPRPPSRARRPATASSTRAKSSRAPQAVPKPATPTPAQTAPNPGQRTPDPPPAKPVRDVFEHRE